MVFTRKVYRRSLVRPHGARLPSTYVDGTRTCAARKDSAVHVSLSSYSPIKQPGASHPLSLDEPESLRSSCHRPKSVTNHRKSRSFGSAPFPPSAAAPFVAYIST